MDGTRRRPLYPASCARRTYPRISKGVDKPASSFVSNTGRQRGRCPLPPIARPVQSLLGRLLKAEPEIQSLLCVDPVETAADKISALAWRAAARDRKAAADDPSIIRHLHDLAALAPAAGSNAGFAPWRVASSRSMQRVPATRTPLCCKPCSPPSPAIRYGSGVRRVRGRCIVRCGNGQEFVRRGRRSVRAPDQESAWSHLRRASWAAAGFGGQCLVACGKHLRNDPNGFQVRYWYSILGE